MVHYETIDNNSIEEIFNKRQKLVVEVETGIEAPAAYHRRVARGLLYLINNQRQDMRHSVEATTEINTVLSFIRELV